MRTVINEIISLIIQYLLEQFIGLYLLETL